MTSKKSWTFLLGEEELYFGSEDANRPFLMEIITSFSIDSFNQNIEHSPTLNIGYIPQTNKLKAFFFL